MSPVAEWPVTAPAQHHDARDDDVIYLSPEEIEVCLAKIRRPLVEPAPIQDPALINEEADQ